MIDPTRTALIFAVAITLVLHDKAAAQENAGDHCRVVRQSDAVEIQSPFFVFRLNLKDGLRAESWLNRLTGNKLVLGGHSELEVDVGLPSGSVATVHWLSATLLKNDRPCEVVFELKAQDPKLTATVKYVWNTTRPVLRKFTEIRNDDDRELNRLLNCRLGQYKVADGTGMTAASGRGFPAYVAEQFFFTLAHPAGFADVENGRVILRQYPGARLAPSQTFRCMEAVYGVAGPADARSSFVRYLRSRMRRVLREHDRPYAILESFGGQPSGDFWTTEEYLLDHLAKVASSLRDGGPKFDFYSIEFWHDVAGDLTGFHPKNFPHGFSKVRDEILRLGMRPGLWIDSGGLPAWTIRDNPAIRGCFTKGDGKGEICRATEPINSMYKKAFIRQVRENKVGLLKFDNLGPACQFPNCENAAHEHLPGPLYSIEAIHNAAIDFLKELDAACPEVFIMLYWGYRSPWWLEYGDTYFENGQHMEAASPSEAPAPNARVSVTQRLDQAQSLIVDTPWLGKDSLGIWLSDWPWNSCIGKANWQEGLIMDLCRGSLLAQIWTDTNYLSPREWKQLADFIALLKSNPECFDRSRPILGDPSKNEPYGYACGNGKRAFLAVHNACLEDRVVTLPLGPACGLPDGERWDVYRWHPQPARLTDNGHSCGRSLRMALRPYEVVLLEVMQTGDSPSLGRSFGEVPVPTAFSQPARALDLKTGWTTTKPQTATQWHLLKPNTATADKASLTIRDDASILAGGKIANDDVYTITAQTDARMITGVMLETLTDDSLPGRGPGRAENGNFALTGFRLLAASKDRPDQAKEVKSRSAQADFWQDSYGGWPVTAAIDDDAATGWSIFPEVGMPHAAAFELDTPIDFTGGTTLTFKLTQGQNRHSLGRLRLSISTDRPLLLPLAYRPGEFAARAELPPRQSGGILLLTSEKGSGPPRATLAGQEIRMEAVWSEKAWYNCPWQAWRAEIPPDQGVRQFHAVLKTQQSRTLPRIEVHFLPR